MTNGRGVCVEGVWRGFRHLEGAGGGHLLTRAKYLEGADWATWIPTVFEAMHFLTLTSKNSVYDEVLTHRFGYLIQCLNRGLFGNNFRRHGQGLCYVQGVEPQLRGVLHLHAVLDEPRLPYDKIHEIWNRISGYAWVEPVTSNCGVAEYVSKYSVKGGRVSIYVPRQKRGLLGTGCF